MKKVKDNITKEQFSLLISSLKGNERIRANRKDKESNLIHLWIILN